MRFLGFGFFYFSVGMAVAQNADYTAAGWVTAGAVVVLLASLLGAAIGVFGGKVS